MWHVANFRNTESNVTLAISKVPPGANCSVYCLAPSPPTAATALRTKSNGFCRETE